MGVVRSGADRDGAFRPVRAAALTGTLPGFARPHFLPEHVGKTGSNTFYVQRVIDERIISFEPLEEGASEGAFSLGSTDSFAKTGDPAVYVYAFGPEDVVVGFRERVATEIKKRFDEIAAKEFAACTAAQFARLTDRIPEVNRRAFRLLSRLNLTSARQWRDSAAFPAALREELRIAGFSLDAVHLHSRNKKTRLEVMLNLTGAIPRTLDQKQLERSCKQLLIGSGLFEQKDTFALKLLSNAVDDLPDQLRLVEATELDTALEQAKLFLEEKVFVPALAGRGTSDRIVNVVLDTRRWISKFAKVGDLVRYMDRFKPDTRQTSLPLAEIKNIRFEDVHADFMKRFEQYRGFQTSIADFREGAAYSPFALSIYTRTYNNRGGGIRPVGKVGSHEAVVVNVTLGGGRYANEWLDPGVRLKCYLKSPRQHAASRHEESNEANQSIMKFPHVPILLFTRTAGQQDFVYCGVFHYTQVATDQRGAKWFELAKRNG